MKEFLTVEGESRTEIEIKHSKFIATAKHVETKEEAQTFLQKISKEFSDATHNCYAFSVGFPHSELKFSDNGEPSGTAGQPILDVIKKTGLNNICIVVTRYFGGIKLGASGLVGAYSSSSASVVKQIPQVKMVPSTKVELTLPYTFGKKVETLPQKFDGIITSREYSSDIKLSILLPVDFVEELKSTFADVTSGQGRFEVLGEEYRKVLL